MKLIPRRKQKLINETLKFLLAEIEQVDSRTAKALRQKINGRGTPVYFKILPKQNVINSKVKMGQRFETKGLTTTIYDAQTKKPIAHVITIPEEQFFTRQGNRLAVRKQGIVTLLHELKHLSRAGFEGPKIMEELEADLFTIKMLKALRMEKERKEYVESRPLFKKVLEKAKAKKERAIRARILKAREEQRLKKLKEMIYEKRGAEEEYARRR